MTNLSPVTINISNESRMLSLSRLDRNPARNEELSCRSTMVASSQCDKAIHGTSPLYLKAGLVDFKCDGPNHTASQAFSSDLLKFMLPRPNCPTVSRLSTFEGRSSKEITLSDLRNLQRSPLSQKNAHEDISELFNHSTGTMDQGPSSYLPRGTNFLRMPLSAGANDITSWKHTSRRRRRKGKLLLGISPSVRSLPRELAFEVSEEGDTQTQDETASRAKSIIEELTEDHSIPSPPFGNL